MAEVDERCSSVDPSEITLHNLNPSTQPQKKIHYVHEESDSGSSIDDDKDDEEERQRTCCAPEQPPPPPEGFWGYLQFGAVKVLAGLDFAGEKLADFFGITSPKYAYILREVEREREEQERALRKKQAKEDAKYAAAEGAGPHYTSSTAESSDLHA
eukprot:Opistho-2@8713